jgi:uncharacterized protein (DUF1330 family)
MADKEVAIKINVDADGGAKSLSELKKEFKETQQILSGLTAGSKEYIKTLEKLGGIKDDIGDLNSEIKAFNPEGKIQAVSNVVGGLASGFQAAQGAAALFGAEGEELQKTLLKVQAASAFADGIKGVMGMGDAFKELGLVIKANPIMAFLTALLAIGAAAYALYNQLNGVSSATANLTIELEKQKKSTELLNRQSTRQIELLTAQGGSEREIIAVKEKLIAAQILEIKLSLNLHKNKLQDINDNNSIVESVYSVQAALFRKLGLSKQAEAFDKMVQVTKGERAKEDLDAIAKEKEDLLDLQNALKVLSAERINIGKAEAKEKKEIDDKTSSDALKAYNEFADKENKIAEAYDAAKAARKKKAKDDEAQGNADALAIAEEWLKSKAALDEFYNSQTFAGKLENLQIQMDAELALVEGNEAAKQLIREEYAKKESDLKMANAEAYVKLTNDALAATQALTDIYFADQLAKAKGNDKKEREIRKKQFNVNKAFTVAGIVLNTVMGMIKAVSNNPPPSPIGIAGAVITGIMGTAATVKALATKFDDSGSGGGGGGATASLGSAGGGVGLEPPQTGSTSLNADGTIKSAATANAQPTIKAVVVETDITKSQKRVNTIEERASL